jgi:hypothetical protein
LNEGRHFLTRDLVDDGVFMNGQFFQDGRDGIVPFSVRYSLVLRRSAGCGSRRISPFFSSWSRRFVTVWRGMKSVSESMAGIRKRFLFKIRSEII